MKEKFLYNTKTHTLHIEGYCIHAKKGNRDYVLSFNTENEVLSYDGRAVGMCKLCQKKREEKRRA